MWTASTELWFPLPVSPDLGLSGRIFTDMGALSGLQEAGVGGRPVAVAADGNFVTGRTANFHGQVLNSQIWTNDGSIRLSAGIGLTWNSPFGLINLDIGEPIIMYKYDMTELFRVGFGTRF